MNDEVVAASGLASLVAVLQFHGIPADPDQLSHRAAGQPFGPPEIVRTAREHNLKASIRKGGPKNLPRQALPASSASTTTVT